MLKLFLQTYKISLRLILSDSLAVQEDGAEGAGFFDVYAVDAHEGIDDGLSAIGGYGIAHCVGHNVNRHSALYADAVAILRRFGGNSE